MSRGTFVERNQTRERLYTIHVTARMIESYCNRYTYSYVYKFYMSSNTRSLYMHIEMQFQSILNLQVMFWYILELVLSLLNLPNFHEYTHSVSRHSSGMRWIVQSLFNIVYIIYLYHCVDVLSHYSAVLNMPELQCSRLLIGWFSQSESECQVGVPKGGVFVVPLKTWKRRTGSWMNVLYVIAQSHIYDIYMYISFYPMIISKEV